MGDNEKHEVNSNSREENTVVDLVAQLESKSIQYAIARNYEDYPSFGHDLDLFVHHIDTAQITEISIKLACVYGWDYVTCCNWDIWFHKKHSVKQIRFYKLTDFTYLQVDLIHLFPLYGLALMGESEILIDREKDLDGKFYKISKSKENLIRVFQIFSLLGNNANSAKVARYSKRLVDYVLGNGSGGLLKEGEKLGVGSAFLQVVNLYNSGDLKKFKNRMLIIKLKLLMIKVLKEPFLSIALIVKRIAFYIGTFFVPIQGCHICIYLGDIHKSVVFSALKTLKEKDYITNWLVRDSNAPYFNKKEHKIMEIGGVLIQWLDKPKKSCVDLCKVVEDEEVLDILKYNIIFRHSVIYNKNE